MCFTASDVCERWWQSSWAPVHWHSKEGCYGESERPRIVRVNFLRMLDVSRARHYGVAGRSTSSFKLSGKGPGGPLGLMETWK